ncbi:hypothetical protein MHTCC0001_09570 [Flavobacteriaceae bacterium MHTCC 0001]
MLQTLLTIGIAVIGLTSGWFNCLKVEVDKSGKSKRKLNHFGYFALISLVLLTALSSFFSYKSEKKSKILKNQETEYISSLLTKVDSLKNVNNKLEEKLTDVIEYNQKESVLNDWVQQVTVQKDRLLKTVNLLKTKLVNCTKSNKKANDELEIEIMVLHADSLVEMIGKKGNIKTYVNSIRGYFKSGYFFCDTSVAKKEESAKKVRERNILRIDEEKNKLLAEIDRLITQHKPRLRD